LPSVLYAQRAGDPRKLPGFEAGRFVVQDAGAGLANLTTARRYVAEIGEVTSDLYTVAYPGVALPSSLS
jgi:hypothetical protein